MVDLMKECKYFAKFQNDNGDTALRHICKKVMYEHLESKEFVFHELDKGSKFYVIISGEVSVLMYVKG